MKGFSCSNEFLKEARNLLSIIDAPKAAPRAIVDLEWADNELSLSAYDGQMAVKINLPCNCDDPDKTAVDAKAWWRIIAGLDPESESTFKLHKTKASFTSGQTKASFRLYLGSKVTIDESESPDLFLVSAIVLRKIFTRVLYAAGDAPPVNSIRLYFADGKIELSATTKLTFAYVTFPSESVTGEREYFIPKESIAIWRRVLPAKGAVAVHGDQAHLGLRWGRYWSSSAVMGQGFPDLGSIVEKRKGIKNFIVLDKDQLRGVLTSCAEFVRGENKQFFHLLTNGKSAVFDAEGTEIGDLEMSLQGLSGAGGLDTHLDIDLVLKSITAVDDSQIIFAQRSPNDPLFVQGVKDFGLGMVMPLVVAQKGKVATEKAQGDF